MGTKTWKGNGDNWETGGDWTPAGVPISTDDVTIGSGDPLINSNVQTVDSVTASGGGLVMNDGELATIGNFSIGSGVGIDGGSGEGGSTLDVGGALSVAGTGVFFGTTDLAIGNPTLSANTTVEAASLSLTSTTRLVIDGNDGGGPQVSVQVAGPAGFGTMGTLTGSVVIQNSTLQFGTGQITSIDASSALTLNQASISNAGMTGNTALNLTQIGANGALALDGGETATSSGSLVNDGLLTIDSIGSAGQSYTIDGSLTNNDPSVGAAFSGIQLLDDATLTVKGGFVDNTVEGSNSLTGDTNAIASLIVDGAATGGGSIALEGHSYLEFGNASDNGVAFSASANTLKLDSPAAGYTGKITGFASGDVLDLGGETASIQSYDGKTLVVQTTSGASQSFALAGPAANGLQAISDNNGGTDIVLVCFCSGTLIRTARGQSIEEIAVEALRVGDLVVTAAGEHRPIKWLGHRTIDCRNHPDRRAVSPICVIAGAFGGGLPERDLYLSPGHPVRVGEGPKAHLVPIMCLINGTSIAPVPVDQVTYWHVELSRHDLLLAEGLPAESYLDWGDRSWFEEGADHALMNPDFIVPGLAGRCLPVAIDGPLIEAERRRIDALFEMSLAAQCAWPALEDVARIF